MTSDNKTFMLILNISLDVGSDSESDSGDSYLATALARLGRMR